MKKMFFATIGIAFLFCTSYAQKENSPLQLIKVERLLELKNADRLPYPDDVLRGEKPRQPIAIGDGVIIKKPRFDENGTPIMSTIKILIVRSDGTIKPIYPNEVPISTSPEQWDLFQEETDDNGFYYSPVIVRIQQEVFIDGDVIYTLRLPKGN